MPTPNPRISVTLTPKTAAALQRFSHLANKSQSSMISEMLDESVPMLLKMIRVIEAANKARDSMAATLVEPFQKAHQQIEHQLGLSLDSCASLTDDLLNTVEKVSRRTARTRAGSRPQVGPAPASDAPPPLSNRGGRTPPSMRTKRAKSLTAKSKAAK